MVTNIAQCCALTVWNTVYSSWLLLMCADCTTHDSTVQSSALVITTQPTTDIALSLLQYVVLLN